MGKFRILLCFSILIVAGCASTKPRPYWDNPTWVSAMGKNIQNNVRYPEQAILTSKSKHQILSGMAAVEFTYEHGHFDDCELVTSTGNDILDQALKNAVATASPPSVSGPKATIPRRFLLTLSISPGDSKFLMGIHDAVAKKIHFPYSAMMNFRDGVVIAQFNYRNGVISNVSILKPGDPESLNEALLEALSKAKPPSPPSWIRDKTLRFKIPFCFALETGICSESESSTQFSIISQSD